jgi:hypothetical protein
VEGGEVQCAPRPPTEARTIQEDAGPVDHAGAATGGIGKDAVGSSHVVVLELPRVECGGQGPNLASLVLAVEVGADRATAVAELGRRLRQDPETAATPYALPSRREELVVEAPGGIARGDLGELGDRAVHRSRA